MAALDLVECRVDPAHLDVGETSAVAVDAVGVRVVDERDVLVQDERLQRFSRFDGSAFGGLAVVGDLGCVNPEQPDTDALTSRVQTTERVAISDMRDPQLVTVGGLSRGVLAAGEHGGQASSHDDRFPWNHRPHALTGVPARWMARYTVERPTPNM